MQFTGIIKAHIENMVCPVHGIHPIVDEELEGLSIHCCCNEFHKQCAIEAEIILTHPGQAE